MLMTSSFSQDPFFSQVESPLYHSVPMEPRLAKSPKSPPTLEVPEKETKKGRSNSDEKLWPFKDSNEKRGTGKPEDGSWHFQNPIVRRPDVDRQDFKGSEAFITLTTADFSAAVVAIQAKLIRERAPTNDGKQAAWEFTAYERKSIGNQKQTIRVNLNDVNRDFFRYKKWGKQHALVANSYFVVVYFYGVSGFARVASPPFDIHGRTKQKKKQKIGDKRKPEESLDVLALQETFSRVEVTPLSLDMEPKAFCDLVEARNGLTCKAWIELVQYLVSKLQISSQQEGKGLPQEIPLSVLKHYKAVTTDTLGYSPHQSTSMHFYGLMKSFTVPKDEKKPATEDNLVVTARNLLVVLEFFRPFNKEHYTVADCLQHMTRNLADSQGRCYWWYHGLISKEDVYRILYDDVSAGKCIPVSRSFCVRFRYTESQSMSIIHYRWERDGPKWKERFIVRSQNAFRMEDIGSDHKLIEAFERPTVAEVINELSNPLTRGERVLMMNPEVASRFYLEDVGPIPAGDTDWTATLFT